MGPATVNGDGIGPRPDAPREVADDAVARVRAMARSQRRRAAVMPEVGVPLTPDTSPPGAPLDGSPSDDSPPGHRSIPDARPPEPAILLERADRASEPLRERYDGPANPPAPVRTADTTIERTASSTSHDAPPSPKREGLAADSGGQPQPTRAAARLVPFGDPPLEAAGMGAVRRPEASREAAEAEPSITVHIGRVEVQSSFPEPASVARAPSRRGPILSLSEYLKQRNEGTR